MIIPEWIRESNLIEGVDDPEEDRRSTRAWNWFRTKPLTLDNILILHRKIMQKKLPASQSGHWRTYNVRVGPRICPPWHVVPTLIENWFQHNHHAHTRWTHKEKHVEFEKVHPFLDGNGRIGRMILNHERVAEGMDPLCIKAAERWDYYAWFEEVRW